MKTRNLKILIISLALYFLLVNFAYSQNSTPGDTIDQWKSTTSPQNAITPRISGKDVYAPYSSSTWDIIHIASTTATSTFNNGLRLNRGCFAIGTTCVAGVGISSGGVGFGKSWEFPLGITDAIGPTTTVGVIVNASSSVAFLNVPNYINLGAAPAQSGGIRLSNNQPITARDSGNSTDLDLVILTSSDDFNLGGSCCRASLQGSELVLDSTGGIIKTPSGRFGLADTNSLLPNGEYLLLKSNEDLSANKTLNLILGNTDRTLTLSGNPTIADWFDQSVKTTASPTFANITDTALVGDPGTCVQIDSNSKLTLASGGCVQADNNFTYVQSDRNDYLTPTSTAVGLLTVASSTISNLTSIRSTSTQATTTYLNVSQIASTSVLSISSKSLATNGSQSAPAYSFTNSSQSGLFLVDANTTAFSQGNTKVWDVNSGNLRIFGDARLDVSSVLTWTNAAPNAANPDTGLSRLRAGEIGFGTGAVGSTAGNFIATNSTTTQATTTYLGVSTLASTSALRVSNLTTLGNQTDYPQSSTSTLPVAVNAMSFATTLTATPLISVDTSNTRVGINKANPNSTLEVNGINQATSYRVGQGSCYGLDTSSTVHCLKYDNTASLDGAFLYGFAGVALGINNVEKMRINSIGNMGIATKTPISLLQIAGNAASTTLTDTSSGIDQKHWSLVSNRGYFWISTTSDAYASTSLPVFILTPTGRLGLSSSSPAALLTGVATSSPLINFATSSLAIKNNFLLTSTGTALSDGLQLNIGSTTQFASGNRDALSVMGRTYTPGMINYFTDFIGNIGSNAGDAANAWDHLNFDVDGGCTQSNPTAVSSSTLMGGIMRFTTGAAGGNGCHWDEGNVQLYIASSSPVVEMRFVASSSVSNMNMLYGLSALAQNVTNATSAPLGAFFWYSDTAGANGTLQAIVRDSATTAATTSLSGYVLEPNRSYTLRVELTQKQATFIINGEVVAVTTSNIPAVGLEPELFVETMTGATKGIDVDYWWMAGNRIFNY